MGIVLVLWIVFGAIAGWVAHNIFSTDKQKKKGLIVKVAVGVLGAVFSGWAFSNLGLARASDMNMLGIFISMFGAVSAIAIFYAASGGSTE